MEFVLLFKYFLCLLAFNLSVASDAIESHPNLQLLPQKCGAINEDRIISNKPHFEEFPWLALIAVTKKDGGNQFVCTGTIINSKYVLTAAHCTGKITGVRIGDYNIKTIRDCEDIGGEIICASPYQDIEIEETVVHPNYTRVQNTNDIALLRLKNPVNFENSNAGAVCLPTRSEDRSRDLTNTSGTLAGWKLLENPSHLLKSGAKIYSDEDCKKIYRSYFHQNKTAPITQICAEGFKFLESGAPLMVKSDFPDGEKYVQYGSLSMGKRDGLIGHYSDVRKYMKWILDTIKP